MSRHRAPSVADREPSTAAPIAIADRFPATVDRPDGARLDPVRVVITRDELFVFQVVDGTPTLVAQHPWELLGSDLQRNRTWRIVTPGGVWSIAKAGGCGCGSPLKTFVPWTPYRVGRL